MATAKPSKTRETPAERRARELASAVDERKVIRIRRRSVDEHHADVYVVGLGAEWVLLQPVHDRIDLDGYEALRVSDIGSIEECPRAAFIEAVLKKRGQRAKAVRVSLDSTATLLSTAMRAWPLLAIHREKRDPDVCEVGRVIDVEEDSYLLEHVDLDGVFEDEPESFPIKDVTRVEFGTGYVSALAMVGDSAVEAGAKGKGSAGKRKVAAKEPKTRAKASAKSVAGKGESKAAKGDAAKKAAKTPKKSTKTPKR